MVLLPLTSSLRCCCRSLLDRLNLVRAQIVRTHFAFKQAKRVFLNLIPGRAVALRPTHLIYEFPFGWAGVSRSARSLLLLTAGALQPIRQLHVPCRCYAPCVLQVAWPRHSNTALTSPALSPRPSAEGRDTAPGSWFPWLSLIGLRGVPVASGRPDLPLWLGWLCGQPMARTIGVLFARTF